MGRGMVAACSSGSAEGAQHHWSKDPAHGEESQAVQPLSRGMVSCRRMDVPCGV